MDDRTRQPPVVCSREDALSIVRRLQGEGHVAYFAGGCVRDLLLNITPNDFDVATDAPPGRVRELFRRTQEVGAKFGVMLVHQGRSVVEVATFRADGRYSDGRRPDSVRFSTAPEDARRRDFTINGLFLDPVSGAVIDHVGGRKDLEDRVIRAIGAPDDRFEEDHLRMLRAVRFAARFGFRIEQATADAIRRHAVQLMRISPERIADELRAILCPPTRGRAWRLILDLQLAAVLFRDLRVDGSEARFDGARSPLQQLPANREVGFGLALLCAAICYRQQLSPARGVRFLISRAELQHTVQSARKLFRISNDESDAIREIGGGVSTILDDPPPGVASLRRFLMNPRAHDAFDFLSAMYRSGACRDRILTVWSRLLDLMHLEVEPVPFITGDDLVAHGRTPGPAFKRVLDTVYDAQLENQVRSRAEAMKLADELWVGKTG